MTREEIEEELLKCKNDALYFAEKYCKLMTPDGIKNIKLRKNIELRKYQIEYLRHLEQMRNSNQ